MRYLTLILLIVSTLGCDAAPVPTTTPTPSAIYQPTPTSLQTKITKPASQVPTPARQYAVTLDDLLVGYRLVEQNEGTNFYSSRYENDDKFRKFAQTIYVLPNREAATQQMPRLLNVLTDTLRERTDQPLILAATPIGDASFARQYRWGSPGSARGAVDLAFRYQNAIAFISYTYDVAQMPDDEAGQRARGLLVIILGKMLTK